MLRFVAPLVLLLTSGCAWTVDSVDIRRPSTPVVAVPGADRIMVTVTTSDARQEREISHKKNGYGMRGADIIASNDVVAEVREGIVEILREQGFRDGPGGATIRVELSRFYSTFDTGFWSATANAQVTASVTVVAADGRNLYARVFNGNYQLPNVQIMNGSNAANALRPALGGLLRQIADDPQLTRALLQAVPDVEPPSRRNLRS
ncbi:YajG family lipoprotein [Roseomonas sp. HJA6]|uniref:YajG family lipoprotein n=1 Tax=Roseomonas alba TaxID=2846776 RepID=A0ABS7A9Y3_9PROT|nr:YajG family lipoprotein [Neoroseomonas alba]MBW6399104.1 YajG family lipoprotein [Neoroseomonas alba]